MLLQQANQFGLFSQKGVVAVLALHLAVLDFGARGADGLSKIADLARTIPEVTECHRITGEDCFILKVFLKEISSLDRVLDKFLVHGQTTTSIVQSSPVPPRGVPLPEAI